MNNAIESYRGFPEPQVNNPERKFENRGGMWGWRNIITQKIAHGKLRISNMRPGPILSETKIDPDLEP